MYYHDATPLTISARDTSPTGPSLPPRLMPPYPPCRFLPLQPGRQSQLRLFCFPHAGGGTTLFDGWPAALPPNVQLCPIYLPGRERRAHEPPVPTLPALVEILAGDLLPYLDCPFVLWGQSMGALIAFELIRHLRTMRGPQPIHLFVAACPPPHLFSVERTINHLSKEDFVQELRRLRGTPEHILRNAELLDMVLPVLRADFSICETYTYLAEEPIDCSITAFGGTQDFPVEHLAAWSLHTRQTFSYRLLPGDHFFPQRVQLLLLNHLCSELASLLKHLGHGKSQPTTRERNEQ